MIEEAKSYPMLEREIRNPVIKERFEDRMERYQRENRKESYKDAEMDYSGAFESDIGGCSSMGERSVCIREVAGSTPVSSTTGELNEMENKKNSAKTKN